MTPQQKQEQYQAIQSKMTVKPSLSEICAKHPNQVIIFEKKEESKVNEGTSDGESAKSTLKYCERCFYEYDEKAS